MLEQCKTLEHKADPSLLNRYSGNVFVYACRNVFVGLEWVWPRCECFTLALSSCHMHDIEQAFPSANRFVFSASPGNMQHSFGCEAWRDDLLASCVLSNVHKISSKTIPYTHRRRQYCPQWLSRDLLSSAEGWSFLQKWEATIKQSDYPNIVTTVLVYRLLKHTHSNQRSTENKFAKRNICC